MPGYAPTPEQEAILGHDVSKHARVLAGPGTGKSATLACLVDRILSADQPPRVKLVTFTRAATAELAHKVDEHPAAAAARPSTIHSFSISVLLRNPGAGGFPEPLRIADDWERQQIVLPSLRDMAGFSLAQLKQLFDELAANWQSLSDVSTSRISEGDRTRFLGAWNEHRRIYGYTLLAELPYSLLRALQLYDSLRGIDYNLLVVDEYQDLNACDLQVLQLIAQRGCRIVAAGDDDQSIYSFRKAAPEGIRIFLEQYPGGIDYTLSVSLRCRRRILEWANHVIRGDPRRPPERALLSVAEGAADGEVALLGFRGDKSEADGVAELVKQLVSGGGLAPRDILILFRSDHNGNFSRPVKEQLGNRGIPWTNPDAVEELLAEPDNRRTLAILRLLVHRNDSLAWATLLDLAKGIGPVFRDHLYSKALTTTSSFGATLLELYARDFPDGPRAQSARAKTLAGTVLGWLDSHSIPDEPPVEGWGHWVVDLGSADELLQPTENLQHLLKRLDEVSEPDLELGRFLSQAEPLGRDLALAESDGVRIMTMAGSKGLTVRAAILVGVEDGLVPRPDADLSEERRILYVGMTRAKEYLYCTWAGRRRGPTARAGVGTPHLRRPTSFFDAGPVASQDGPKFLGARSGHGRGT